MGRLSWGGISGGEAFSPGDGSSWSLPGSASTKAGMLTVLLGVGPVGWASVLRGGLSSATVTFSRGIELDHHLCD